MVNSNRATHMEMMAPGRLEFLNSTTDGVTRVAVEEGTDRSACIEHDPFGEWAIAGNVTVLGRDAAILRRSSDTDGRYPVSWLFRRRSGMSDVFRPFISRVLQANLLNHWFDMDLAQHRRRGVRYFKENGDSTYRGGKLESIQKDLYSDFGCETHTA